MDPITIWHNPACAIPPCPLGTRLCRPSETVLEVLATPQRGAFAKEDGQVVVDADGRRRV